MTSIALKTGKCPHPGGRRDVTGSCLNPTNSDFRLQAIDALFHVVVATGYTQTRLIFNHDAFYTS